VLLQAPLPRRKAEIVSLECSKAVGSPFVRQYTRVPEDRALSDSGFNVDTRPANSPVSIAAASAKRGGVALQMKRLTDIALSTAVAVVFSPAMILICLAIRLDSPGSPIFKQKRVGRDGKLFEIYKFRTMYVGTPQLATDKMVKLTKSPITKVGQFLRKTSLDELPQLINVLRGEMSLVGPRPALFNQYELTEKRQAKGALSMPPGITGWAQINGRDELPDDHKVDLDAWYCAQWHYLLDWQIMAKTVAEVVRRRGAW
jgi:O-antigen biosynthesis protein WbqP